MTTGKTYYPALDGLRGIAILLVVLFHNFSFSNYLFFGWLGVDLFFVLSGFLITDILIKSVGKAGYLRKFYLRRMLRIFPLYYLLLIICLLILPAIGSFKGTMNYYTEHQWWFWLYFQNWLYIIYPPEQNNFILHLWSLAVEEQFYIIWPFVILLVRKIKSLIWIVIVLLIAVMVTRSLLWITNTEGLQYFNLYIYTRIDGICIGCALALIRTINPALINRNMSIIVLAIAALNFSFYFLNRIHDFNFPYYPFVGYTTFAILFAILVDECITNNNGWTARICNIPPLKFFGKISYGFYIIHWPVYKLVNENLITWLKENQIPNEYQAQMISAVACTGLAILLSTLSYYFFEARFLRLKNSLAALK